VTESLVRILPLSRPKRGRGRGQTGTLEIVGKKRQRWRGHYLVYETFPDGQEIRRHKTIVLGLRSELTRHRQETRSGRSLSSTAILSGRSQQNRLPLANSGASFFAYVRAKMENIITSQSDR
jgi:hypothetical protein